METRRKAATLRSCPRLPVLWGMALLALLCPAAAGLRGHGGHHNPRPRKPAASHDYKAALGYAIQFFEGQRSGRLDLASMRTKWRGSAGLNDGKDVNMDLTGGYYVSGETVKFGFPLAFSMTMLAWSLVEYPARLASAGQTQFALSALRWGTDYLLKTHARPYSLCHQVGAATADARCWQRPEESDVPRTASLVGQAHPGADVAGETAAALAAASLALSASDAQYARRLLGNAKLLFTFAQAYPGRYSDSFSEAESFYPSSGYRDELVWAATWLWRATGWNQYLSYLAYNDKDLGGSTTAASTFNWDVKYPGAQVLLAKLRSQAPTDANTQALLAGYRRQAEVYLCKNLPGSPLRTSTITQGGLLYQSQMNNQYTASTAFLLLHYADTLTATSSVLQCGKVSYQPQQLVAFAKGQVDYILGSNPANISYMVGFGPRYPVQVHHRGASMPSIYSSPGKISCATGNSTWLPSLKANPNVHIGAIVGGADSNDKFVDIRTQPSFTAAATFINAPMVGTLARLSS